MTEYDRVYFLDSDLIPICNTDYHMELSYSGVLEEYVAMQGDKELCLDAGMNDYVSKPLDTNVMHARVHTQLRVKRLHDERNLLRRPRTTYSMVMGFFNNLPPAVIYDRLRQFVNRESGQPEHVIKKTPR